MATICDFLGHCARARRAPHRTRDLNRLALALEHSVSSRIEKSVTGKTRESEAWVAPDATARSCEPPRSDMVWIAIRDTAISGLIVSAVSKSEEVMVFLRNVRPSLIRLHPAPCKDENRAHRTQ